MAVRPIPQRDRAVRGSRPPHHLRGALYQSFHTAANPCPASAERPWPLSVSYSRSGAGTRKPAAAGVAYFGPKWRRSPRRQNDLMYARRGLCRYVGAPPTPPVVTDSTTAQDLHAFSFCDQLEQLALVQRHPFLQLHSRYAFALYTRSISHRTREEARLALRRYRNGHLCLGACMMCVSPLLRWATESALRRYSRVLSVLSMLHSCGNHHL
jgi:hypothetical protein